MITTSLLPPILPFNNLYETSKARNVHRHKTITNKTSNNKFTENMEQQKSKVRVTFSKKIKKRLK